MFEIESEPISDVFLLRPKRSADSRGEFVKSFHFPEFEKLGCRFEIREEFFSTSAKNVLRGMHFQIPPHAHNKLLYCIQGRVLDVVLDLRTKSKTFGQSVCFELNAENRLMVWIPIGFAHGFLSLEDGTCMVYKTDCVYAPQHDTGLHWNSFAFTWPVTNPLISDRDNQHPPFGQFSSPF